MMGKKDISLHNKKKMGRMGIMLNNERHPRKNKNEK